MLKLLPNIRVNYGILDILAACFITSRRDDYSQQLADKLRELLGNNNVILTSSGRASLYYVLQNLTQRKVIVPAYTCDVVVEAATMANKTIIYAHVDARTLNVEDFPEVDDDSIFIATHQYGFPCKIIELCAECKQKGAVLIEDCAGAFGTQINGQMVGTFGDFAIFSFNASKLINAPSNGGFLIAKNEKDYISLKESVKFKPCSLKYKVKSLCKSMAFCFDKNPYIHYWLSRVIRHKATKAHLAAESFKPNLKVLKHYHYGFYNWQAYVVLKQIRRLSELIKRRIELKQIYQEKLNPFFQSHDFERQGASIRYPVYLKNREAIRLKARKLGVELGFGFEHFVCPDDYVKDIEIGKQITYLPYSSHFRKKEINQIIKVLNQVSNEQSINS